jgi:hypothetical protein
MMRGPGFNYQYWWEEVEGEEQSFLKLVFSKKLKKNFF